MAAIVLHDSPDAVRRYQLSRPVLGAIRHAVRPADIQYLVRMIGETLALRERRRWSRTPLAAPPSIATPEGRVRLLNVSYGGVRLQFSPRNARALPALVHLELPSLGLLLNVQRIWSHATDPHEAVSLGAAIAPDAPALIRRWRRLVDALRRSSTVLF